MKWPRNVKRYCPKCKKHTLQAVERMKKRKASEKPTKRIPLRLRCKTCGKAHQVPGFRIKKFELSE
jgi:large subunit ribosomal protein L44e